MPTRVPLQAVYSIAASGIPVFSISVLIKGGVGGVAGDLDGSTGRLGLKSLDFAASSLT